MDCSCSCSAKLDKVLEKINSLEETAKHSINEMKACLQNTRSCHSEELPRKKRRHFLNRCPESSVKAYVHKEVLQEKYQKIVNRLDFSKGYMLDELVQGEAISESDHENILKLNQKRKDQNRYLIHRFRHYGSDKFEKFLHHLEGDFPDLSKELKLSYSEKLNKSERRKCVYCMIIQTVDISDILDTLFENKLIDDAIIEERLHASGTSHASLWRRLFDQIKDLPLECNCKDVFVNSLAIKYKDIANAVNSMDFQNIFHCSCLQQKIPTCRGFETDGSGSLSDVSSLDTCTSMGDMVRLPADRLHNKENMGADKSHYGILSPNQSETIYVKDNSYNVKVDTPSSHDMKENIEIIGIDRETKSIQKYENQGTIGLNLFDVTQDQPLFETLETSCEIEHKLFQEMKTKHKPMENQPSIGNNKTTTPIAQTQSGQSYYKSPENERLPLVIKATAVESAGDSHPSRTPQRMSSLRQSNSFRMSSTHDHRRFGISLQQAEQFIRWTSRDPNRRDRRTPRSMTT